MKLAALLLFVAAAGSQAQEPTAAELAGDTAALDRIIVENYGYQEHWPGGTLPQSDELARQRSAVTDRRSLLRYVENRIASLADHHAIAGSSFKDSWALVPTYSDLWVERRGSDYFIDAVRADSPAAAAGIAAGDRLVAVGGVPMADAVAIFWEELGLTVTDERADYAARLLAAGRRDRPRDLTLARDGASRRLTLPSLYTIQQDRPPVTVSTDAGGRTVIQINNALSDQQTIPAFDSAMAAIPANAPVIIDVSDTPSGGNTSVARAIMGWFVDRPRNYQVHRHPAEERQTGIPRQWIEQVLPREGKYRSTLPIVRVSRWTGSMGEGIAVGFAALGARVEGTEMAQLKGAIYDFTLPASGLVVKLPVERLYTVQGQPREAFVPAAAGGEEK